MFPRVSLRLIWHAADEEFAASATLLVPANIESYFCIEDVVVLSRASGFAAVRPAVLR